jgi:hypothetical protein
LGKTGVQLSRCVHRLAVDGSHNIALLDADLLCG